jgi:FMN phosphatase YigB (HAD superfamily)
MDERFKGVRAVGFDLDQTLYPDTAEIRAAVRNQIYAVVSEHQKIPLEDAKGLFERMYAEIKSGGRVLEQLGVPGGRERQRDCLDRAEVHKLLKKDDRLVEIIRRLSDKYSMFLITDSRRETANRKLEALGIDYRVFDYRVYWDMEPRQPGFVKKDDASAYKYVQERMRLAPGQIAYVGNSETEDIMPSSSIGWKTVHLAQSPSSSATAGIKVVYDIEGLLL